MDREKIDQLEKFNIGNHIKYSKLNERRFNLYRLFDL